MRIKSQRMLHQLSFDLIHVAHFFVRLWSSFRNTLCWNISLVFANNVWPETKVTLQKTIQINIINTVICDWLTNAFNWIYPLGGSCVLHRRPSSKNPPLAGAHGTPSTVANRPFNGKYPLGDNLIPHRRACSKNPPLAGARHAVDCGKSPDLHILRIIRPYFARPPRSENYSSIFRPTSTFWELFVHISPVDPQP